MQEVLSIEVGGKTIVSKAFDFEAMCLINDAHSRSDKVGVLNFCRDAVDYMFEGTDATQKVIDGLKPGVRAGLCLELWKIYQSALSEKNE